jgi:DUF4097 and DUF4098 domain-containing protein YvlB
MKRIIFTLAASIIALSLIASEGNNLRESKREITREFSVGANPTLQIENKYGHIRIVEGTDNKIMFKIEIIGKGTTEAQAREYAETVSVDFSQSGDRVIAKTVLKDIRCNNCGRETHYTVVAPRSVMMNLENKYGNIFLENSSKPLTVDLKYGNLEANTLANINIDIKYGNVTINACEEINIDCGYSKVKIGRANRMKTESKYDDFQIGTISELTMNTKYTKVKIDRLNHSFVCNDFSYGSLDISEISPQFARIKVDARYSGIKLALDSRHSFRANLSTRYGKINAGSLTFNNVSLGNRARNTEAISGTVGSNSNPSATVDISASYGDIVFK